MDSSAFNSKTYFESYADLEIHELMLKDTPRNEAYREAIFNNRNSIKGKTVLDVGAGTGLLSVYFAQAGAAKVYAVEASNCAKIAELVVKENNFSDIITVIHSRIEDVILPGDEKVDFIVSEWMGFYLLHEGMLDSVIYARDKFLKDGGSMFPETASIYVAPCSIPSVYEFWKNVSGVSMCCVGETMRHQKSSKPDILTLKPENILSDEACISFLDLQDISIEDLDSFTFSHVAGSKRDGKYQGLCLWFDVGFPIISEDVTTQVFLKTGPNDSSTHWKQTVIVLPNEIEVEEGFPIAFELNINRSEENSRRYNIQLTMVDPDEVEHPVPCDCYMTKCLLTKKCLEQYENMDENCDINNVNKEND